MKRFLFMLIVCVSFNSAKAQVIVPIPVTDVAHIKKQVIGWAEQLGRMSTMYEFMSESEDYLLQSLNFYMKVRTTMENSVMVYKILESQYKLIEIASDALTLDQQHIGSEKIYSKYKTLIIEIMEKNNSNAKQTADYIIEGYFKMSEAERLASAEQIEKRTKDLYSQIYTAKKHFESANRRALAIKRLED